LHKDAAKFNSKFHLTSYIKAGSFISVPGTGAHTYTTHSMQHFMGATAIPK